MDEHKTVRELRDTWDDIQNDSKAIASFLKERGGLPGERANITLAVEAAEKLSCMDNPRHIIDPWLMNDEEYLGIVAILTLGNIMRRNPGSRESISLVLGHAVINKKWRIREAIPLALKGVAEEDPEFISQMLESWTSEGYPIMFRTAIETLKDVKLLKKNPALRTYYRGLHLKAMAEISFHPKETGKPMELLKTTLNSSIITLTMLDPNNFELMEEWGKDPNLRTILRKNLGNPHFRQKYPDETAQLLEYIETGQKS